MPLTIPSDFDATALGIYNVKASPYFAHGDGLHDDSAAIQAAINTAYLNGGGIVYLPSSKYLLNGGTIVKPPSGTPGDPTGASCSGLPAPLGFKWAVNNYYYGPNCPSDLALGPTPGTLPPTTGTVTLPNGPITLFDNVILVGDGPEQTYLLVGEQIYDGWMF